MIVATAGHIDHGKTTLVRALTGVDTDRLPEEKLRGISIDLGFAYWTPPADGEYRGSTIGFVDVPGHERFVRNMLAGVCGVDFVMLVVAADDGVMPQTVEHLHIIDLLQVRNGLVVITKCDRVGTQRVLQVSADVKALLAPTGLAGIPTLAVSATSGEGIDALRAALAAAARGHRRRSADGRRFRFAVDRAFTIPGSGTIVTGTVFAGSVAIGERLLLTPSGIEVRVRVIQQDAKTVHAAQAGERCSLNLAGTRLSDVARGDWVVDPVLHAPTQRIDARIRVLDGEAHALNHWAAIRLHLGTRDVTARVALRRGASVLPGQVAMAQLILDKPIAALNGDRFILRDLASPRTIGGGTVVDPFAPKRARAQALRVQQLDGLAKIDPDEAMRALVQCSPGGVDVGRFETTFNLGGERLAGLLAEQRLTAICKEPRIALPQDAIADLQRTITTTLTRFHASHPQAVGIEIADLHRATAPALTAGTFQALLRMLAPVAGLELTGSVARQIRHIATDNPADLATWQRIVPLLEAAGLSGMTLTELAFDARIGEPALQDFLGRKARTADVIRVVPNRFYLKSTLAQAAAIAQAVANAQPDGKFSAAQFRDSTPIGRTRAIEILECLDRLGITRRSGEARIVCRDFTPILGPAAAASAASKAAPPTRAASPPGAARARVPIDNRGNRGNASSRRRAMHR